MTLHSKYYKQLKLLLREAEGLALWSPATI